MPSFSFHGGNSSSRLFLRFINFYIYACVYVIRIIALIHRDNTLFLFSTINTSNITDTTPSQDQPTTNL